MPADLAAERDAAAGPPGLAREAPFWIAGSSCAAGACDLAATGRRWARSFLAEHDGATADEIEQAAAAFQEPYYSGQRTPEGDALNAAFGRVIEAALAGLRAPAAVAS